MTLLVILLSLLFTSLSLVGNLILKIREVQSSIHQQQSSQG